MRGFTHTPKREIRSRKRETSGSYLVCGFTLIETIIYAALISVVIGGVLFAVYQMVESRYRLGAFVEVEEESRFLMAKINWALDNLDFISEPALNATSSVLTLNKLNFSPNPIKIYASGTQAFISYGGGESMPLASESVLVRDLIFRHFEDGGFPAAEVYLSVEYKPREQITIYGARAALKTTIYARK